MSCWPMHRWVLVRSHGQTLVYRCAKCGAHKTVGEWAKA